MLNFFKRKEKTPYNRIIIGSLESGQTIFTDFYHPDYKNLTVSDHIKIILLYNHFKIDHKRVFKRHSSYFTEQQDLHIAEAAKIHVQSYFNKIRESWN